MKKSIKLLMPIAVAAIAFVSCQKEVEKVVESALEPIHITVKASPDAINADPETKTYIGNYKGTDNTVLWGENEYMSIMVQSGENSFAFATSNSDNASAFKGDDEAYFEFDLTPAATVSSYTYGGLYPASAAIDYNASTPYNSNKNGAAFKVSLPSTQNATADSYDPAAYIMVAKPEPSSSIKTDWTASYRRATALNKVTLKNIPEDIVSVEFTAPTGTYMAGRRYIDLTTGESGELYGDTRTETIQVNAALTGTNKVVWFTSWETIIPEGEKFTIVAKSATKSYTRELTAKSKGISFKEGYLNTLNVDMAGITGEDLVNYAGNYLILAMPEAWRIMTSSNTSNYYGYQTTSVTTTDEAVVYSDFAAVSNIEDYIWNVAKVDGGYSIKSAKTGKYVTLTSDGNNAYVGDDAEAFDLSINETTHAAVIKSNTYTERVLMYNSGSPRFAFYKGTQQPVYMVKVVVDTRTPVTLSFSEANINKTTDNYSEFTGQAVTITSPTESEAQTAIRANISYEISTNTIATSFNTETGAIVLNGTAGTATVTASYDGDTNYRPAASVSYTIKVTQASSGSGTVYTLVIDKDAFTTGSYASNNGSHTTNATASGAEDIEVSWTSNNVQKGNSKIHWKSNAGYIYNTTDLGNITDISIDSDNASDYTINIGSSENPTSNEGSGGFFYIKTPTVSGGDYSGAITITFTVSAGGNPDPDPGTGNEYTAVAQQTIDFSSLYSANTVLDGEEIAGTNCSVQFDKADGSNAPQYYASGTSVRMYAKNTLTVTAASGYKITSITITFGSSDGTNAITSDVGSYDSGSWTGEISDGGSVVFTEGGSSGNRRIASIQIN